MSITLDEARKILGKDCECTSDEELQEMIDSLSKIAELYIKHELKSAVGSSEADSLVDNSSI